MPEFLFAICAYFYLFLLHLTLLLCWLWVNKSACKIQSVAFICKSLWMYECHTVKTCA